MRRIAAVLIIALIVTGLTPSTADSSSAAVGSSGSPVSVAGIEFLGEVTFPTGFVFQSIEMGGLSAITYDSDADIYYALSDDLSVIAPARFYTLTIDLVDAALDDGDVEFIGQTTLLAANGRPFPASGIDPEGMVLTDDQTLFISSEGLANDLLNPFVNEFSLGGPLLDELRIPEQYLPTADQSSGIRNNLAFESLTLTPNERKLITATEGALFQDGPAATPTNPSSARVAVYRTLNRRLSAEYVYEVDPVQAEPVPAGSFSVNGLVELLALDNNGTLLALERSFSVGVGNDVRLYVTSLRRGDKIGRRDSVADGDVRPLPKELLLDFADLGLTLDNLEGMTLGPVLADGRQSLIVVSDNNFNPNGQFTQFLAFALDLD